MWPLVTQAQRPFLLPRRYRWEKLEARLDHAALRRRRLVAKIRSRVGHSVDRMLYQHQEQVSDSLELKDLGSAVRGT